MDPGLSSLPLSSCLFVQVSLRSMSHRAEFKLPEKLPEVKSRKKPSQALHWPPSTEVQVPAMGTQRGHSSAELVVGPRPFLQAAALGETRGPRDWSIPLESVLLSVAASHLTLSPPSLKWDREGSRARLETKGKSDCKVPGQGNMALGGVPWPFRESIRTQ